MSRAKRKRIRARLRKMSRQGAIVYIKPDGSSYLFGWCRYPHGKSSKRERQALGEKMYL